MINLDTARVMIDFASEAYYSHVADPFFQDGYKRPNANWYEIGTRGKWLATNRYTRIENPTGRSDPDRYYGIIAVSGSKVIVAFRGTSTWGDAWVDGVGGQVTSDLLLSFPFAAWNVSPSEVVWVHQNFLALYQSLQDSVRMTVKSLFDSNPSLTELYVTGHSLGGALATLCAIDLSVNLCQTDTGIPSPAVYTFASPRVGDERLRELQARMVPEFYRFELSEDLIPKSPHLGQTPPWQAWFNGGMVGAPPRPPSVPYVAVGDQVRLRTKPLEKIYDTLTTLYFHSLGFYNGCLGQASPLALNGIFKVTDQIKDLTVKITTSGDTCAGTDDEVLLRVLGVSWGPLVSGDRDDFERGTMGTYPLFDAFPDLVPPNPLVGDLTEITLSLGRPAFFSLLNGGWKPSKVELMVNGLSFTSFYPTEWLMPWPKGLGSWTQSIDLSDAR